jgi:hypothetical protein
VRDDVTIGRGIFGTGLGCMFLGVLAGPVIVALVCLVATVAGVAAPGGPGPVVSLAAAVLAGLSIWLLITLARMFGRSRLVVRVSADSLALRPQRDATREPMVIARDEIGSVELFTGGGPVEVWDRHGRMIGQCDTRWLGTQDMRLLWALRARGYRIRTHDINRFTGRFVVNDWSKPS